MKVIHITENKNTNSIMKNGIFRNKPLLPQYNDVMKNDYGNLYDETKGLVFGIPEEINKRDKYIKDFFYWKAWGNPRNIFIEKYYEKIYDLYEIGPSVFSSIKKRDYFFDVLLLEIPSNSFVHNYAHQQTSDMSPLYSDMNIRYEHNDKPLVLLNYDVEKNCIIKKIGSGEAILNKKDDYNILLRI